LDDSRREGRLFRRSTGPTLHDRCLVELCQDILRSRAAPKIRVRSRPINLRIRSPGLVQMHGWVFIPSLVPVADVSFEGLDAAAAAAAVPTPEARQVDTRPRHRP